MKVPFLNMQREAEFLIRNGLTTGLESTIMSGQYLFGPRARELEEKLSEKFNAEVVLVGSGTDAITLSLLAYNIGPKDTVIVPAFTAIPTAIAVKMTGAQIKSVYITEAGFINEETIWGEGEISAIVPVHLYGNPMDITFLRSTCRHNNIVLIEDCAQAFGTRIGEGGQLAGTLGHTGAFSFYPTKNLGCFGDGGAIVTKDTSVAQKLRELRFYGQKNKSAMGNSVGMNSRMDELQCTILLKKLSLLATLEERRLIIFRKYMTDLRPHTIRWISGNMPHLFPILVHNRYKFMRCMLNKGVETSIHYPFTLPAAVEKSKQSFPVAEKFASQVVSIPFHPWLTDEEVDYIIEVTKMCLLEVE